MKTICANLRQAQAEWFASGLEARVAVMRRWADALQARYDELVQAEILDTGRFRLSEEIVNHTIGNVLAWADQAPEIIENAA